jgi:hypothetical protein
MDKDMLIAIVGSMEDAGWGSTFITENSLSMQLGVMRKNKGDIQNHIHKVRNRQTKSISNEFHYVVRGKVLVRLYGYQRNLISKVMLTPQMYCMLFNGGHGFEIVKDDTLMFECKLGNYTNVEEDKEKFD